MRKFRLFQPVLLIVFPAVLCVYNPVVASPKSYKEQRHNLVDQQIAHSRLGQPVGDTQVLQAMKTVPRHEFVQPGYEDQAYRNRPLPIGQGQTISQPYVVARMTELLDPSPDDRVLEIGTGSGYQAAVLAEIVDEVYTIEIIEELYDTATKRLKDLGYENVHTRHGDGYNGWEKHAPYDGIIVTAAPSDVPQPLIDQLKKGGHMVLPVGSTGQTQMLKLLIKTLNGNVIKRNISRVRFVPFIREESE